MFSHDIYDYILIFRRFHDFIFDICDSTMLITYKLSTFAIRYYIYKP